MGNRNKVMRIRIQAKRKRGGSQFNGIPPPPGQECLGRFETSRPTGSDRLVVSQRRVHERSETLPQEARERSLRWFERAYREPTVPVNLQANLLQIARVALRSLASCSKLAP